MHRFSSVAIVDTRGWILLQERDEHPPVDPECWGFPGGGVEEGETFEDAAYRELEEETGIRLDPGTLRLHSQFTFFSESCGENDTCGLYVAHVDLTDDDVECHEGRQMVFVDPGAAGGLPLATSARLALPDLLSSDLYAGIA
ncbi:NUDIX domain-containing protein [Nocardioides sp. LHG3406-4]|uniref:NUDIX domain-containing protein n=1 Tax=Nocardioides sp. LHG3406-4 TaxID=2804575 RepID=UPI003CEE1534